MHQIWKQVLTIEILQMTTHFRPFLHLVGQILKQKNVSVIGSYLETTVWKWKLELGQAECIDVALQDPHPSLQASIQTTIGCSNCQRYVHTTLRCSRWISGSPRDSRLILVCLPNETQKKLVTHVLYILVLPSASRGPPEAQMYPRKPCRAHHRVCTEMTSNQRPSLCGRRLTWQTWRHCSSQCPLEHSRLLPSHWPFCQGPL